MLRVVALAAAALAAAGSATAFSGIQGSYTTTITGVQPQILDGPWRITFHVGVETITHSGTKVVSGHYALAGDKITISRESGKYACGAKPGVYRWSLSANGKLLTLTPVSETCSGRKLVLTAHPLHKVG